MADALSKYIVYERCMHGEDYTVAKLDWHARAVCQTLLGVTKNQ